MQAFLGWSVTYTRFLCYVGSFVQKNERNGYKIGENHIFFIKILFMSRNFCIFARRIVQSEIQWMKN